MATKRFPHTNNFTSGEVSTRFQGRTDQEKYYSGLQQMLNFIPFIQGGMTRRPGLRFGINSFCSLLGGRIIPFKFTRDVTSNFIIHLCDELLHITDSSGTEVDIAALQLLCEEVVDDGIFVDPSTLIFPDECARFNCTTSAKLNFRAAGGTPPYVWSVVHTGEDPVLTPSGPGDRDVLVTAPINLDPSTNDAYLRAFCVQDVSGNACRFTLNRPIFRCDGTQRTTSSCSVTVIGCPNCCHGTPAICDGVSDPGPCTNMCPQFGIGTPHQNFEAILAQGDCPIGAACQPSSHQCGQVDDLRSAPDIASGCAPCVVGIDGAILTVTDAALDSVSITLRATI